MKSLTPSRPAVAFLLAAMVFVTAVSAQDKGLAPPTRLWAAQTDPTTITLVWQGVPGAAQYLVFGPKSKKGDAGAAIQQLATLGRNTVRFVALVAGPGLRHQFSIQAVDAKGQVSDKAEFNAVIPQAKQAASTKVPPPSSVTASQTGSGEVRLVWSSVPDATGYFIGRSVAPGGFKTLCQLCPTETNYVDTAVTAGAKHIYTVAAITPFGTSQKTWSNEVTPTTGKVAGNTETGDTDGPPKGVTNPKAALKSPTSVTLTWRASPGAAQYEIRRAIGNAIFQIVATVGPTVTQLADLLPDKIPAGSLVRYTITAINPKGRSSDAVVTIDPQKAVTDSAAAGALPKGLSDLKATIVSPTSVRLTWEPVRGYTSFRIKRRVGLTPSQVIATLAGTVFNFLDHFGSGSLAGGISYEVEAVDAKGSSTKATVALAPEKAATDSAGLTPSPKGLSGLKATIVSPTSVRLTWEPVRGYTSFRIKRRVGLTPSQVIATLAGTVFNFLDHFGSGSLAGGVSYEVEAVDAKGSSTKATVALAPEKAATDSALSTPSPKGPSGLKATVVSPTLVRLTWSPGVVGAMYRVMREVSGTKQVIATLPGNVSNFLDHFPPGGVPGVIGYWVEAVDGKGASEKVTLTMDPAKDEGEIDSLPRPRGRP